MPLPPKELYSIADVADRWNVPAKTIEDYLLTGKLQSSIFLPRKKMYKYVQQLDDDFNPHFDGPPYKYDTDFDDPDSISFRQGVNGADRPRVRFRTV